MRSSAVVLSLVVVCRLAPPASASDGTSVDLEALLEESARASPELLASRERAKAAATLPQQREALPDPKLTLRLPETNRPNERRSADKFLGRSGL